MYRSLVLLVLAAACGSPADQSGIGAAAGGQFGSNAAATSDPPPATAPAPVPPLRISRDSIGPLALTAPLATLRRKHPQARDTVFHDHEAVYPAVLFSLPGLSATGVQTSMNVEEFSPGDLRPDCPASFWIVEGDSARLPGGVPLSATWAELLSRYGPVPSFGGEYGLRVNLERLPGFAVELNVDPETLGTVRTPPDLARVPAGTRIARIFLDSPTLDQDAPRGCPLG